MAFRKKIINSYADLIKETLQDEPSIGENPTDAMVEMMENLHVKATAVRESVEKSSVSVSEMVERYMETVTSVIRDYSRNQPRENHSVNAVCCGFDEIWPENEQVPDVIYVDAIRRLPLREISLPPIKRGSV
jgi:hypothetical protein